MNLSPFLGAFAGALAVGAATLLIGASNPAAKLRTMDVQRINVREPHPDLRSAGLLFNKAERTENGGLIFDGKRDSAGEPHSSGTLTFDRYKQDQLVHLVGSANVAECFAGLSVNDQPKLPIDFAAIDRARALFGPAQLAAIKAANAGGTQRAFAGRGKDGASEVVLEDASGAKRLRLRVNADGQA